MKTCRTSTELSAPTNLDLTRGRPARIDNGRGVLVLVEQGAVWLTLANDTTDVCLEAGESFRIDRDGPTVISALSHAPPALVTLVPPAPAAPTAAERVAGLFWKLWRSRYDPQSRLSTTAL